MRGLALCLLLLWGTAAQALDTQDQLTLSLDGGEALTGWFVRAEADAVVLSVRGLPAPTRVPLDIVSAVSCNGQTWRMVQFRQEVSAAHRAWLAWLVDPPPHPPAILVAAPSLVLPGTGHAMLGEWKEAGSYMIADLVVLGVGALELHGSQRLGVLVPLAGIGLLLRGSAAADAVRMASRRAKRLRDARAIVAGTTQG